MGQRQAAGYGCGFVCHPRGESIQPRRGAGLSTYLLVGFRQIVLYLHFLFSTNEDNVTYREELQYETVIKH